MKQKAERGKRAAWAAWFRRRVQSHPKAWALISREGIRKRVICANRRAAKTESIGCEIAARLIGNDHHIVWVFAGDLGEYSRNWLSRKPNGLCAYLEALGVPHETSRQAGHIRRITFPWGSSLEVFSAKDEAQIDKARGGALNDLVLDEAQKLHLLSKLLLEVVGPAGSDFKAEIWAGGTPGKELDSLFAQASQGKLRGWHVGRFYSWDNPHFGDTWAERYQRAVIEELREWQDEFGLSDDLLAELAALTEEDVEALEQHPVYERLLALTEGARILREYFGRWIADTAGKIWALAATKNPYYFTAAVDRIARGEGDLQDLLTAPDRWAERIDKLPRLPVGLGMEAPQAWRAVISVDLGYYPDPTAFVIKLWAPTSRPMYELDSTKALKLLPDEQTLILQTYITVLQQMGIDVVDIVVDASGGQATSQTAQWAVRFAAQYGITVSAAEKFSHDKESQIFLINGMIRRGELLFVENSPLDIEMRHLEWMITKAGKRKPDKNREITLPDGTRCFPGDHASDAFRYLVYKWGFRNPKPYEPPLDLRDPETVKRELMRKAFRAPDADSPRAPQDRRRTIFYGREEPAKRR